MQSQPHIRLFDNVEIALNVVGGRFQTAIERDGIIHFEMLSPVDGAVIHAGTVTFNVFWSSQRENRELFDREILEQLIIKRVQDYQNEISLVPVRIIRATLEEVQNLQNATTDFVDAALAAAAKDLGPLTALGQYRTQDTLDAPAPRLFNEISLPGFDNNFEGFKTVDLDASASRPQNELEATRSKPDPLPSCLTAAAPPSGPTAMVGQAVGYTDTEAR